MLKPCIQAQDAGFLHAPVSCIYPLSPPDIGLLIFPGCFLSPFSLYSRQGIFFNHSSSSKTGKKLHKHVLVPVTSERPW